VSLRTSCHAFALNAKTKAPAGSSQWPTFDVDVLGCHYANHLSNKDGADIANVPEAAGNPILAGVTPVKWHSTGSLYKLLPLDPKAQILMTGAVGDHTEPVAWTRAYRGSRIFSTTLGHPDDFKLPQFQQLLVNAIRWAAAK
jgi:type 1 glutamine amidotransferase